MPTDVYAEPETLPAGVGAGWQDVVPIAQPAAGAGVLYKIKGEYITRLVAVTYRLTCSGIAGNRSSFIALEDPDSNEIAFCTPGLTSIANAVLRTCLYIGGQNRLTTPAPIRGTSSLFDLFAPPGYQIRLGVDGMDIGDQLSGIFFTVDQRYTGKSRRGHHGRHHGD